MEKITNNNGVDNRYMLLYKESKAQYNQYRSHLSPDAKLIEPLEMLTNRIEYQKGVWKLTSYVKIS